MKYDEGATRKVFIFKRFVVKIPTFVQYKHFLSGILANLQEKQFSGVHPDLARVWFCDRLGLFLIMERAQVFAERMEENESWGPFIEMLEERYKDDDLKEFMLSDGKPHNWGYIGEHLVKIDYGS